jgi:hypothetical protein
MSDADLDADDQQVEVESENEGDRPGSREVTPAAMRGPAEGEAHSPGEVENSFPDFETLLVDSDQRPIATTNAHLLPTTKDEDTRTKTSKGPFKDQRPRPNEGRWEMGDGKWEMYDRGARC